MSTELTKEEMDEFVAPFLIQLMYIEEGDSDEVVWEGISNALVTLVNHAQGQNYPAEELVALFLSQAMLMLVALTMNR
jgi:hypothetical protein